MTKKINFAEVYKEQKAEGVDIKNHMNNLITQEEPAVKAVERRTKRVQLVMTPKLYEQVKKEAGIIGVSFNELVNQLCINFLQKK